MTRAQKILSQLDTPSTLEEMDNRLSEISNALPVRGRSATRDTKRDFHTLTDLMMYVEIRRGERSLKDIWEQFPDTDPLTLISTAKKFELISADTARSLKAEFMTLMTAAVGHELTAKQAKNLFHVLRSYDPVPGMKLKR